MKELSDNKLENIQPGYLNRQQIAKFLGVSVRTISNMIRQRRIPFIKFGGTVRFDPVKVRKALEKYAIHEI
jgi:excisionase family DNA binding protein